MVLAQARKLTLTAVSIATLVLGFAQTARAEEPKKDEKKEDKKESAEAEKKEGDEKEGEEEEPGWMVGLEVVTGFGKVEALNLKPPTSLATVGYEKKSTSALVVTPIASLSFPVSKHIRLGARFPFVIGQFSPDDDKSRGAANWGNVELEAEYEREISKALGFEFGLGLALPTARGDEIPEQDTLDKLGPNVNTVSADKFAINHAAQFAHGGEENALFEPQHLGIVPKVAIPVHLGRLKLEPYVKVENLIATFADAPHPVTVELVAGGRVAYGVASWLDLGVRAWGNFTLTEHDGRDLNIGALEPEVRLHYKATRAVIGGIIPFAGEPSQPGFGGVRAGLMFAF